MTSRFAALLASLVLLAGCATVRSPRPDERVDALEAMMFLEAAAEVHAHVAALNLPRPRREELLASIESVQDELAGHLRVSDAVRERWMSIMKEIDELGPWGGCRDRCLASAGQIHCFWKDEPCELKMKAHYDLCVDSCGRTTTASPAHRPRKSTGR